MPSCNWLQQVGTQLNDLWHELRVDPYESPQLILFLNMTWCLIVRLKLYQVMVYLQHLHLLPRRLWKTVLVHLQQLLSHQTGHLKDGMPLLIFQGPQNPPISHIPRPSPRIQHCIQRQSRHMTYTYLETQTGSHIPFPSQRHRLVNQSH